MFKETTIDLGTLIGYIVPGFVALAAAAYFVPELGNLLGAAARSDAHISPFALLSLAALPLGMIVSVLRGSSIDHTFRLDLYHSYEHYRPLPRVEPLLAKAHAKSTPEVVGDIRLRFHAPFHFYGNTIVALGLLFIARAAKADISILRIWIEGALWLLISLPLYSACRSSYARLTSSLQLLVSR